MSAFVYTTAIIVAAIVIAALLYMCFIQENLDYIAINQQNVLQTFPDTNITSFPIGTIVLYPSTGSIPEGWILCDGTTQYTGNNGQTLTAPDLNGNTQILPQIATKLKYVFIIKTSVSNASTLFPLNYDGTNFSVGQSMEIIPNNIITLFNGPTPPAGWTILSTLSKNFTPFTSSAITITQAYQTTQKQLSGLIQALQADLAKQTDNLSFYPMTWETVDRDPIQSAINLDNAQITAFQAQQSQMNACITSAQNDLTNINSTTLQNLGQTTFISNSTNFEYPSTYGKLAMDSIGNLLSIPSLPSGIIILWNGNDSQPPANIWNTCSATTCGNLSSFPLEKYYPMPGGNCAYAVSQLLPDTVFLYSLS